MTAGLCVEWETLLFTRWTSITDYPNLVLYIDYYCSHIWFTCYPEAYLQLCRTSTIEPFFENSERLKTAKNQKLFSQLFDWVRLGSKYSSATSTWLIKANLFYRNSRILTLELEGTCTFSPWFGANNQRY